MYDASFIVMVILNRIGWMERLGIFLDKCVFTFISYNTSQLINLGSAENENDELKSYQS